eukprot:gene48327-18327_t
MPRWEEDDDGAEVLWGQPGGGWRARAADRLAALSDGVAELTPP